jgi:hypothetical protein
MKLFTISLALLLTICGAAGTANAQQLDVTVTPNSFSYPSGDPDTTPVVAGPPLSVSLRVTGNRGWTLTIQGTNLAFGSQIIPATNVTWTASAPLQSTGTLNTSGQTLAQGSGNQNSTSSITFSLQNLWTYNVGTYTQTITFTLSSP